MSPCQAKQSPLSRLNRRQRIAGGVAAGAAAIGIGAVGVAQPANSSPLSRAAQLKAHSDDQAVAKVKKYETRALRAAGIPVPRKGKALSAATTGRKPARVQDVLKLARSQIGIHEVGRSTKFNRWYMTDPQAKLAVRRDGGSLRAYAKAAWCDMFVSWVGRQTNAKGMGVDAYTQAHARWFKKVRRWGSKPAPGAVVFFSWSGRSINSIAHVGIVVRDNRDGTISSIEGNTDDAVKQRRRKTSTVVGYGYPVYRR